MAKVEPMQDTYPPTYTQSQQPGMAGYSGAVYNPPTVQGPNQMAYNSTNTAVVAQPQPQTIIVTNHPVTDRAPEPAGQIFLACFVFWCCCWPLGLAAFIVAIMATSDSNAESGRQKLRVAGYLNIAGLVIGSLWILLIIILSIAG